MDRSTRSLIKAAAAAVIATGTVVGFEALSRLRWHRTGVASLWEVGRRATGSRKNLLGDDLERFEDYVARNRVRNEREYAIPSWLPIKSLVFEETRDGMRTYHLGTTGKNTRAVLFLHGGDYLTQMRPIDWLFADRLCRLSGAEVCVPIYPLAPAHDYDEAYSLLIDLYEGMVNRYGADDLSLVGSSSGGGLAAGIAEALKHYQLPQPGQLVLISPELDLSLRNDAISDYFDRDPSLAPWGLAQAGDLWADGDDISSPRLSPINGDVSVLRNVTTFVGAREILYPDCATWDQLLEKAGVTHRLVTGESLSHEWPLALIPEARNAVRQIASIIHAGVQETR